MHEAQLLFSKVIDSNDVAALTRFGITERMLPTEGDRQVFRFINDYATQNRGQAPSYATVAAECPDFVYSPQVGDSYEYLTRKVKEQSAMLEFVKLAENGLPQKFDELGRKDIFSLFDWLQSEVESIKIRTNVRETLGTDLRTVGEKFMSEYDRRKAGESFRLWKSKFDFINRSVGGYVSSNVYTVYGKSGRGKSVVTLEEALEAATQGANVLIWAMEMGWFEVWVRIFVSLSGRQGVTTANTHGMDLSAGFDSSEVRYGKLTPEFETAFRFFVDTINEQIPGNITVRAVDDEDFNNRTLRQLEADILATKADVVVLDPFYYLDYERNTSKTAGGDAAETSKKLRHLAGRTQTVIFAITQADEGKQTEDEEGNRELQIPAREDVKKTKQLLEDAYLLIGIDTDYKQGRGLIGLNKGRDGGEGEVGEILYIPSVGVVRELETGEAVASHFDF
ncbi:DnaB-like helicase C-terminal domain-containing protein [Robertmurraya sp. DFI.2.37]|uniref:AAA family ATPase n=1 Tax=Robertmurraya sp. DFI.2.37 TaxID=3031819 RepID=UPI00124879EC|nr:DnaB-like helicase C-terminal domain-containing protein [Robertmurraya sp. DFI.2.37]MDF1511170.1 DnaB-like helicase C-terminal domain-containing protein [Robertmurraya sp. DFI.2.37]